jgi:8-amino-7-oxononanoate synthase
VRVRSGYLANTGIIPVLIGKDGLVLLDELSHACVYAGAQLSRGKMMTFRHNDVSHARELLAAHRSGHDRALIITDGVFSMDGDLAPPRNYSASLTSTMPG